MCFWDSFSPPPFDFKRPYSETSYTWNRLFLSYVRDIFTFSLFSTQAEAFSCNDVPSVAWWGNTSPEGLTAFVDSHHNGDWAPYIKKCENYEERMRDVLFRGKSVTTKSKKRVLNVEDLALQIKQISQRVQATRRIADEVVTARLAEELGNMETAAGGNPEATTNKTAY